MACFRPDGVQGGIGAYIGYSPYCVPRVIDGVKCVIVNEALRGVEPMAWDFVMNFARDNHLQVVEAGTAAGPPNDEGPAVRRDNDKRARSAGPWLSQPRNLDQAARPAP